MAKTLVLRSRVEGNWHDSAILSNILTRIAQDKPIAKAAMWMNIAGRVELASEEATTVIPASESPRTPERRVIGTFEIDLNNTEARLLWREVEKLRPMDFGRNQMGQPAAPPLGILNSMLTEWAECLEEKMPQADEDDSD
jgi:hypothetical protein